MISEMDCNTLKLLKYLDIATAPLIIVILTWLAEVEILTAAALAALLTIPTFLYFHQQEKKYCT